MVSNFLVTFRRKSNQMNAGVPYKNQNVYLKINFYLNQASTLPFRPVLPLYRNQLRFMKQINGMVFMQWQHQIEVS